MNFFSTTGFIIIIILTIVNWGIYGLFVRRLYFSREAIWRDIIACFFVAFIEWAIIVWLLAKILIGFLSVLRVIAWIGLIGFSVLIIYVVIFIIKKKTGVYASTQMVERCSRCGEICSGGKFCVKCGSPVIVQYDSADDDDDEDKSKIELFGSTVEPFPAIGISALLIVVSIVLITCIPKWQDSIKEKIGEKEVKTEKQENVDVSSKENELIDIYPLRYCLEENVDDSFGHPQRSDSGRYESKGMTAVCMNGKVVIITIESDMKYCLLGVSCGQYVEAAQDVISGKFPYQYDEDLWEGFKSRVFGDVNKEVVEITYEVSTGKICSLSWADMSAVNEFALTLGNEDSLYWGEEGSDSNEDISDLNNNNTINTTPNFKLEDLIGYYRSGDGSYTAYISENYDMEICLDSTLTEQVLWSMSLNYTEDGIEYIDATRVNLRVQNDGSIGNDISYTGGKGTIVCDDDRFIWNNEKENLRVLFVRTSDEDVYEFNGESVSDFLIPGSDSRRITDEDLDILSAHECMLARNEIYARRGRKFQNEEIREYFNGKSWYVPIYEPEEFNESLLNAYENYNKDYIVEYEKRMGYK